MLFRRHTRQLSQDQQAISLASRSLHVSEYGLFELAYRKWYGAEASESQLEASYTQYLFSGRAPCWVRQYVRDVAQARLLDAPAHKPVARGRKFALVIPGPTTFLFLILLLALLNNLR